MNFTFEMFWVFVAALVITPPVIMVLVGLAKELPGLYWQIWPGTISDNAHYLMSSLNKGVGWKEKETFHPSSRFARSSPMYTTLRLTLCSEDGGFSWTAAEIFFGRRAVTVGHMGGIPMDVTDSLTAYELHLIYKSAYRRLKKLRAAEKAAQKRLQEEEFQKSKIDAKRRAEEREQKTNEIWLALRQSGVNQKP